MTINESETCVWRGAELLDEKVPLWWDRVDTDNLNMADMESCVLGQVYGHWETGLRLLNVSLTNADEYGFVCQVGEDTCSCVELDCLWIDAIKERRGRSVGR